MKPFSHSRRLSDCRVPNFRHSSSDETDHFFRVPCVPLDMGCLGECDGGSARDSCWCLIKSRTGEVAVTDVEVSGRQTVAFRSRRLLEATCSADLIGRLRGDAALMVGWEAALRASGAAIEWSVLGWAKAQAREDGDIPLPPLHVVRLSPLGDLEKFSVA